MTGGSCNMLNGKSAMGLSKTVITVCRHSIQGSGIAGPNVELIQWATTQTATESKTRIMTFAVDAIVAAAKLSIGLPQRALWSFPRFLSPWSGNDAQIFSAGISR